MIAERAALIESQTDGDLSLKTPEELLTALTEIRQLQAEVQELERIVLAEQLIRLAGN